MDERELSRVRFLTTNFAALQGLKGVPLGIALTVSGLTPQYTSLHSGTLLGIALFFPFFLGMIALYRHIARAYERTFGRVEAQPRPPGMLAWELGSALTVLLVLPLIERWLNSPVSLMGLALSLGVAWPYLRAETRSYWRHRGVIGGVTALLSLLPALSRSPAVEVYGRHAAVPYMELMAAAWGLVIVVTGVLDHLMLLSQLRPASEAP